MRCKDCNVDLGENYAYCPLCGMPAVNEAPKIANVETSHYPDYAISNKQLQTQTESTYICYPAKVLKASIALCILGLFVSIIFSNANIANAILLLSVAASSIAYFCFSVFSTKFESIVISYSVANVFLALALILVSLISHISFWYMLIAFAFALEAILLPLIFFKSEKTYEKLKAIFVR